MDRLGGQKAKVGAGTVKVGMMEGLEKGELLDQGLIWLMFG